MNISRFTTILYILNALKYYVMVTLKRFFRTYVQYDIFYEHDDARQVEWADK